MKWSIHHVNIVAHDVNESVAFYRDILGLTNGPSEMTIGQIPSNLPLSGKFAIVGDGNKGLHLTKPMPDFAAKAGFSINPAIGGHLAISVPDIQAVKKRLDETQTFYVDAGEYIMPGVVQIYLYDPSGNIIEINEDNSLNSRQERTVAG